MQVTPAAGIIKPEHSAEVAVHHEESHTLEEFVDGIPQNWWCEDTRDKEVILVVNVQGSSSTRIYTHRIRVRHSFSAKTLGVDSNNTNTSRKNQPASSHHHPSDVRQPNNSSEITDKSSKQETQSSTTTITDSTRQL